MFLPMFNREAIDAYAETIIRKIKENGVWEVKPHMAKTVDGRDTVRVQFTRPVLRQDLHAPNDRVGFYVLFDDWCLNPVYVGRGIVSARIYRFFKELKGLSRDDEDHPAATKYKNVYNQEKIDKTRWTASIVWQYELPDAPDDVLNMVDERVADILGARFNRRTIGNSLPI